MTVGEQVRWWGVALLGFVVVLWFLADVLLPFIIGTAIAYFADPIADRLQRTGMPRIVATTLIIAGSATLLLVVVLLVIPVLIEQMVVLARQAPIWMREIQAMADARMNDVTEENRFLAGAIDELDAKVKKLSVSAITGVLSGTLSALNFIAILVIAPVVAFYMLYDWDNILAEIDDALPRQHRPVIHRLAWEVDDVLAGFVRGQLTVCMVLGTFYAIALGLVGLNFGVLIGALAGLISFIPFIGAILGGVLSVGVALVQFWGQFEMVAAVAAIFAVGQVIEGNYLTPKLVGGHVKLHPVWLMFALAAFGALFGFVGMLVAIPAAAAIGVLGRFLLAQYKEGRLYRGVGDMDDALPAPLREDREPSTQRDARE